VKTKFCVPACGLLLLFLLASSLAFGQATHPLDPLSATEIDAAAKVLRDSKTFPATGMFSTIQLNEPPKDEVLRFAPGASFRREAFSIILDRERNKTLEAVVDLRANKLISWKEIPGVQPLVLSGEYDVVDELVRADPRWQAAMRKRGITNLDDVAVDGWAVGKVDPKFTGRLLRGLSYFKGSSANYYGRPVEGVVAIVNMNTRKVVDVTDTGVVPISATSQDFDEQSVGELREKPKPLVITQPQGASYRLTGQELAPCG